MKEEIINEIYRKNGNLGILSDVQNNSVNKIMKLLFDKKQQSI
jgi:hypothetical protein